MNESSGHYFSATPGGNERRRAVHLTLAGRGVEVLTANGIFSPNGVDKGTAALLSVVPDPPAQGQLLDIGCGWGPLALTQGLLSPDAKVYAVEVNARAAQLCRDNAEQLGASNIVVSAPEEIDPSIGFDLMWSNPPIRIGKEALHELLQMWLPRLNPGGEAWLVVQKNLGADSLLPWIRTMLGQHPNSETNEFTAYRADSVKGFRILRVLRAMS